MISHDAVDMGWSTLGDICIHEGKLLGCSYYQNSVGVWVADISVLTTSFLCFLCILTAFTGKRKKKIKRTFDSISGRLKFF